MDGYLLINIRFTWFEPEGLTQNISLVRGTFYNMSHFLFLLLVASVSSHLIVGLDLSQPALFSLQALFFSTLSSRF